MFIENKYKRIYFEIVERAKSRYIDGYVEKHHIIPKSIGGEDTDANIVSLTAREHFICHRLLTKMTEGQHKHKMLHAVGMFVMSNDNIKRNLTSKQYEIARKSISAAKTGVKRGEDFSYKCSERMKGNVPWNKGLVGAQSMPDDAKKILSEIYSGKSFVERHGSVDKANEIKNKISSSKLGKPSGMLGKKHSDTTKQKMSNAMKKPKGPQQRHICQHCNTADKTARHIKYCNNKVTY